jgi:hypothetical protein
MSEVLHAEAFHLDMFKLEQSLPVNVGSVRTGKNGGTRRGRVCHYARCDGGSLVRVVCASISACLHLVMA